MRPIVPFIGDLGSYKGDYYFDCNVFGLDKSLRPLMVVIECVEQLSLMVLIDDLNNFSGLISINTTFC